MSGTDTNAPAARCFSGQRLRQQSFEGADLQGADFARASLEQVNLRGADLRGACFAGAELVQVDLSGAKLDGADLRGATLDRVELQDTTMATVDARGVVLVQCSLARVEARALQLAGASLTKTSLVAVQLREATLDGATMDDVGLVGGALRDCSLVGVRATGCALSDLSVSGCDLAGASLEDLDLREVRIEGSTLRALSLRKARFRRSTSDDSAWLGAQLEGCRGLGPALEAILVEAGATVVLPQTVRWLRRLRADRRLQLVALALVLALVGAVIALLNNPGLWPSALLLSRVEALERRNDVERCEPLIELASLLATREGVDRGRRFRLLQRMSECEMALDRPAQAQALLEQWVQQAADADPEEHRAALVALGDHLLAQRALDEAQGVAQELYALAEQPQQTLVAQRLEARILSARGLAASPRHPDEPVPEDDPWRSLQLATALTLEALTEPADHHLDPTPTELFVLGEWTRARALLDLPEPPLDAAARWRFVQAALDRLVRAERADLALALATWLGQDDPFDDLADVERIAVTVTLYRRLGQDAEAAAALAALDPGDDPRLAAELRILRARLALDSGDAAAAVALTATPPDPVLPFDVLERHGWLRANALLAVGDEPGAVDALEPLLEAAPDKEQARGLLREIGAWMERLAEPHRVTALLSRQSNPMLDKAGQGQELALTTLRAMSRGGPLAPEDPLLLGVLERGTPEQVQEAASLLLASTRQHGGLDEALETLIPRARKLADERARAGLGMQLAEAAAGASMPEQALAIVDDMRLEHSDIPAIRSRAIALELATALGQGRLDAAIARYREALDSDPPVEVWLRRDLGRRIIDAQQAEGRWDDALALARELRADDPDPELWREAMSCLVAKRDPDALEREIAAATDAIGACLARTMATRSVPAGERSAADLTALEQACSKAANSVEERLTAASALGEAGRPDAALRLLRTVDDAELEPMARVRLIRARAGWQQASGDRDGAVQALEAAYAETSDLRTHEQLTEAIVTMLGDDPDRLVAAYRRFGDDHLGEVELPLWKQAALELIRGGHPERVAELGGEPGWERHVATETAEATFSALIQAGDIEGGWTWLAQALESTAGDDPLTGLLYRAGGLTDRSGEHSRLLAWLDELEARSNPEGQLWQRIQLRRARALEALDRYQEVAALLGSLLSAELPVELRSEALEGYARAMGQVEDAATIEAALASLPGTTSPTQIQALRLRAAEQLVGRGRPAEALILLEPLAGQPLDPERAGGAWDLLARVLVANQRYAEALEVPTHYPSSADPCVAWLALLQHVPRERDEAAQARDGALAACSPTAIPVPRALALADTLAQADPARALSFLEAVEANPGISADDRAQVRVMRGGLLADSGDRAAAIALLEAVRDESEQPHAAAQAGVRLIKLAEAAGGPDAVEAVLTQAERALERCPTDLPARRDIIGAAVGSLQALEAWTQAIAWQARLVAALPTADEGRGYALLRLVNLQLAAHPGDPTGAGAAWHAQLAEAQTIAQPGSHLHGELEVLDLAWQVAQARDEAAILAVLEAALARSRDGSSLLNSVAARLDAWKEIEAAAIVRRERGRFEG